jgi:error-prone DNA polymerase
MRDARSSPPSANATPASRCRTDDFHHGSPGIDPRSLPPKPRDIYVRDLHIDNIKVKTRDFRQFIRGAVFRSIA